MSLISIGWTINLGVSTFVTSMVGQSMSLNIVADVGDKLGDVISKASWVQWFLGGMEYIVN